MRPSWRLRREFPDFSAILSTKAANVRGETDNSTTRDGGGGGRGGGRGREGERRGGGWGAGEGGEGVRRRPPGAFAGGEAPAGGWRGGRPEEEWRGGIDPPGYLGILA